MRTIGLIGMSALALCACGKSRTATTASGGAAPTASQPAAVANTMPARKAGLWRQSFSRDGKPNPMGTSQMCVGATTDAQANVFGEKASEKMCSARSVNRALDGTVQFTSTCSIGAGGTVTSKGTASGDFSSRYHIRSESDVTGASFAPMNGHHVSEIDLTYLGPCPAGMVPGDMTLANGMHLNVNKAAGAAAALGAGR